ncbi:unnamed protein product, partial [Lymnaea stagnalis]
EFYPYGSDKGDRTVDVRNNWLSETIHFSSGLPFGTNAVRFAHVSPSGVLTFGEPRNAYTPNLQSAFSRNQNLIAPFWTNMDHYASGQLMHYHLYEAVRTTGSFFQHTGNQLTAVLEKATSEVQSFYGPAKWENFQASTVLVATWDGVRPNAWYSFQCAYDQCNRVPERNTFQTIYATDGEKAYAITIYKEDGMTWEYVPNRVIVIGYTHRHTIVDLGFTFTRFTTTIGKDIGTAGRFGTFIDKVGEIESSAQKCVKFYQQNLNRALTPKFNRDRNQLFTCPCTMERLGGQWWLAEIRNSNIYCYAISTNHMRRWFPGNTLNKLCCYLYRWYLYPWWDWRRALREAAYVTGTPDAGHILTNDPFTNWRKTVEEDIRPKQWCCREASRAHCGLFHFVRPDMGCSWNAEFVTGSSWGDPHITTLDQKQYTLNGWAEYIMMQIQNVHFMFQARTDRVETANGTLTNATVFVAFAVKDADEASLQVELSYNKTSMVVYADNIDLTTEFYTAENYMKSLENFTVMREESMNKTHLVASFTSGVTLKIFMGIRSLEVSVEADKSLQGNVSGLLGNFNGNPSDDFVLPDGTILDHNLTERQIFENFGKQWEVDATNTIFSYREGEGAADYSHPEFIPLFKDEVDESDLSAAKEKCGENDACIFDFLATGDATFAENTRSTGEDARSVQLALANSLPRLNVTEGLNDNRQWEVIAGQPAYLKVEAEDADNDTMTYAIVGTSAGVRIINNGTLIYVPDPSNPVIIEVQVNDTKGGYSNILNIPVAVCPICSGHGECDKNQVREAGEESSFVVYACNCLPAFTGIDCELDYDACSDSPCAKGQNCSDLSASDQGNSNIGYVCGPCPVGYQEGETNNTVIICEDINECNNRTICDQNCTNTEGSYFCHCMPGYRLDTDLKSCWDINECDERTHNCDQQCVNTQGGFACDCFQGYKLVNDKCTLDETDAVKCSSLNCSQLCHVQNGVPSCLCRSGYRLVEDNKTCTNINECQLDRKPCSQHCTDTIGGFNCSCFAGYNLTEDRISCAACETSRWGVECTNRCQCNGRGRCDPVRGCVCQAGWGGASCNTDINECETKTDNCTAGQVCVNTEGGFRCQCPPGYILNRTCIDVNECADISTHNCTEGLEDCLNNIGSYSCSCKRGYARGVDGTCRDINECVTGTHTCQQVCVNVNGGFNCRCHPGYEASDDRSYCTKVKNLCEDHVNCSHGCRLENNATKCFCDAGYQLSSDNQTCEDINECTTSHQCSSNSICVNEVPRYRCTCEAGSRLDNDGRTCLSCSSGTWGVACNMSCACSTGAYRCDPVSGCICMPGYNGSHCENNINQCLDIKCDHSEECIDRPGVDVCQCKAGYRNTTPNNTLQCQDIDECSNVSLNNCSQNCTNLEGGFSCSCFDGFSYNGILGTCEVCQDGFWGSNCEHQCTCSANTTISCSNVNGYCVCDPGWEGDNCTRDKVECSDAAVCSQFENTYCVNLPGSYRCQCQEGYYNSGSQADRPQCLELLTWGASIAFTYTVTQEELDVTTAAHANLKIEMEKFLHTILSSNVIVLRVNVTNITAVNTSPDIRTFNSHRGSEAYSIGPTLNINFTLVVSKSPDVINSLARAFTDILKTGNFSFRNEIISLKSLSIGGNPFNPNATACEKRELFEKCEDGEECVEVGANATCRVIQEDTNTATTTRTTSEGSSATTTAQANTTTRTTSERPSATTGTVDTTTTTSEKQSTTTSEVPPTPTAPELPSTTTAPELPLNTTPPELPSNTTVPELPSNTTAPELPSNTTAPELSSNTTAPEPPSTPTAPEVPSTDSWDASIAVNYNATEEELNVTTAAHAKLKVDTGEFLQMILNSSASLPMLRVNVTYITKNTTARTLRLQRRSVADFEQEPTLNINFTLVVRKSPDVINSLARAFTDILKTGNFSFRNENITIKSIIVRGNTFKPNATPCEQRMFFRACPPGEECVEVNQNVSTCV